MRSLGDILVDTIFEIYRERGEDVSKELCAQINTKLLREATGRSQKEFAKTLRVSAACIKAWDQNIRQPRSTARIVLLALKLVLIRESCYRDAN